jgi:hypothetical protein
MILLGLTHIRQNRTNFKGGKTPCPPLKEEYVGYSIQMEAHSKNKSGEK